MLSLPLHGSDGRRLSSCEESFESIVLEEFVSVEILVFFNRLLVYGEELNSK